MAANGKFGQFANDEPGDKPDEDVGNRPLDEFLAKTEKREILAALRRVNGERTAAARLLRISRSRLYRRMEALGIGLPTPGSGRET